MKMLPHTHPFAIVWKIIILVASLVFLFFSTLTFVFPSGYSGWNKILHAALAVIFLADIGMQFIMTVKTGHITLEQRKEVRKHYLAK